MEIARPVWQQDLGETKEPQFAKGWLRRVIFQAAVLILFLCLISGLGLNARGDQSFAVALPELEGPVTLGIFSEEGALLRLLYSDAPVESIPAGLNGLIMTWDQKDDQGRPAPAGNYIARGLVHGPLTLSSLPFSERCNGLVPTEESFALSPMPLIKNTITVRAARDALLEKSPPLSITARLEGNACILAVEGLPILSVPIPSLGSQDSHQRVRLAHGMKEGSARLMVEDLGGTTTYEIMGLDKLVPLSAGKLEVSPDAFHSSLSTGESVP
jgi:hypothetical protein